MLRRLNTKEQRSKRNPRKDQLNLRLPLAEQEPWGLLETPQQVPGKCSAAQQGKWEDFMQRMCRLKLEVTCPHRTFFNLERLVTHLALILLLRAHL